MQIEAMESEGNKQQMWGASNVTKRKQKEMHSNLVSMGLDMLCRIDFESTSFYWIDLSKSDSYFCYSWISIT